MNRWHRIALAAALMLLAAACAGGSSSPTEVQGPRFDSGYGVGSNETKSDSTAVPEVNNDTPAAEPTSLSEEESGYGVGSN
jgi:hypothetical protein